MADVRALLFDLGGVVMQIDFARAIRHWAGRSGRDADDLAARFGMDLAYERHERGEMDIAEYLAALRAALEVDLPDDDLLAGWNDIFLEPVPGMVELLTVAARRLPVFAFSNSNPTHQGVWEARFAEHLPVFQRVFVSSDLGLRKPDGAAFEAVGAAIGVPCEKVLFFDDTAENVEGARAVGMQAVHFRTADDARAALAVLGIEVGAAASGQG
jgi:HAD superfamily hydrolase (TIGR01509 family)